jgi:hypothetical protein
VDRYFQAGAFVAASPSSPTVAAKASSWSRTRAAACFVGVFANDLKTTEWSTPSSLLVLEPDLVSEPGVVDLGALSKPCIGAWRLEALDAAVSQRRCRLRWK